VTGRVHQTSKIKHKQDELQPLDVAGDPSRERKWSTWYTVMRDGYATMSRMLVSLEYWSYRLGTRS
jgi:hypothetical protein